jgi:hypothetical protein
VVSAVSVLPAPMRRVFVFALLTFFVGCFLRVVQLLESLPQHLRRLQVQAVGKPIEHAPILVGRSKDYRLFPCFLLGTQLLRLLLNV